ncbi:aldo/keto reductase [Enterovibrio baiacu]|uniref:aldo/keto reductase n=1 Tax=Enterovibrio baiacu TaxID=2491023 RepID=UPI003D13735B
MLPVILGSAKFGTYTDKAHSFDVLNQFIALGGTRIDTANNYACWHPDGKGGESEAILGEWIAEQNRGSIEVMTKIGAQSVDGFTYDQLDGLAPDNILRSIDESLTRLQTDHVDVLYAHVDDVNTPLLDTWKTLSSLVKQGTVKRLGISNYQEPRVLELVNVITENDLAPISHAQFRYTLLSPNITANFSPQIVMTEHLFGTLKHLDVRPEIIGYSPLLDGCYEDSADELPETYDNLLNCMLVEQLQEQASAMGMTTSAWVLKVIHDYGITPVTAASHPDRLKSNLSAFL